MREEAAGACARVVELETQVSGLEAQLHEAIKVGELQKAELERYRRVVEANRPNHPERVPASHLQLAFDRVMETLGCDISTLGLGESPANDDPSQDENEPAPPADPSGASTGDGKGPEVERKKRHSHGRRRLDLSKLPVVEQCIEPPEVIAAGGNGYILIGQEVSERVAIRPAEMIRFRLIRTKYVSAEAIAAGQEVGVAVECADEESEPSVVVARDEASAAEESGATSSEDAATGDAESTTTCPSSTEPPRPAFFIAPLPESIWPNVMGDPSAIAHVTISKYGDLLPLNRQETISLRRGFVLPKSTQCGWLKAAHAYCVHVVDAMMADACKNAFLIATDATSASVLPPRKGQGRDESSETEQSRSCQPWHVFVFIADRDHVVFRYDREHTGAVFTKMLKGYHGNLLADAASVFDVLYRDHGMTENGCWFHARRPFYQALETDSVRAFEGLALISKLFEVDRNLRAENLDLVTFTQRRAEQSRPILKLFDGWVALNEQRVDPRSPLDSAIGYYRNQREALHHFLYDGRIRLDNNLSEQALRNLVVGLANWVFFANETGIGWYTTFRSLIASCALHGLNPEIYLEQLLRIVPHWPKNRALELSPKYWTRTVATLDARWRAMLARPWEPDVILCAELSPRGDAPEVMTEAANHAA